METKKFQKGNTLPVTLVILIVVTILSLGITYIVAQTSSMRIKKSAKDINYIYAGNVAYDVINDAYGLNIPPSYKGKRLKIYFVSQTGSKPPKFTFNVNDKGLVHFSYYRYLENKLRENFDLVGTPIILQFKNKGEE